MAIRQLTAKMPTTKEHIAGAASKGQIAGATSKSQIAGATSKDQIAGAASKSQIAGAIIAGGHSRRFGSSEKALAMLAGLPLIEHVYQRLSPQVSTVWLNLANDIQQPKSIRATLINDATQKRDGPLAGVLSALRAASDEGFEWLLIAPCDTPFIPMNLGEKLVRKCIESESLLGIARAEGWNHPSLSIWNTGLLGSLEDSVLNHSKAGFKQFYPDTRHCFAEWGIGDYDPFFNINTPQDIEAAADIINRI